MTIILSPEDSLRWQEGGWSAWRVEETVYEEVQRRFMKKYSGGTFAKPLQCSMALNWPCCFGLIGRA